MSSSWMAAKSPNTVRPPKCWCDRPTHEPELFSAGSTAQPPLCARPGERSTKAEITSPNVTRGPLRRFGTTARKVDGGYVVNGRKFFVSLAGCAPYYATPAIRLGEEPWIERTLYLQVPKDAPGVSFPGDWDPMGTRGTVSRHMALRDRLEPPAGGAL